MNQLVLEGRLTMAFAAEFLFGWLVGLFCFPFFFFLTIPHSFWDLSSLTRDGTCALCSGNAESYPFDYQEFPPVGFSAGLI